MAESTTNNPSAPPPTQEEDVELLAERLTRAFGSPPTNLAEMTPEEIEKRGLTPLLALVPSR